jgi:hypothetical protein
VGILVVEPTRLERQEEGQDGTLEEMMAEAKWMTNYSNYRKLIVPTQPNLKSPVPYLIYRGSLKSEAVQGILHKRF